MDPALQFIIIPLCTGIIIAWLMPYFFRVLADTILANPVARLGAYVAHIRTDVELWPRITEHARGARDRFLGWARVRRFASDPIWFSIGVVFCVSVCIALFGIAGVLLVLVATGIIMMVLTTRVHKRKRAFVDMLPQALDTLTQALRAGYALPQAIALVAKETEAPVRDVFVALERSATYRIPLRDALAAIESELGIPEWDLFVETLAIQERTGGNSIPMLSSIATAMRQQVMIEHEMRSATAAGRLSGMLIAFLAPAAFLFFFIMNPGYMEVFFTTNLGLVLLGTAAVLEIIGFLLIQKITRIAY